MKKLFVILPLVLVLCFTLSCQQEEEGLTEEKFKFLADKFTEIWNDGNLDLVDEIIAPEYVIYSDPHDPYENHTLDHETYKKRVLQSRAISSDMQFLSELEFFQGNKAVTWGTVSGTNKLTGKTYKATIMTIYHIEDGKIKGHWQNIDRLGIMQQLGFTLTPPKRTEQLDVKK
jgi:hypothetical protein